jgi:iron complex outermembrane recepter protein
VQGTHPWQFAVDDLKVGAVGRALITNPTWFRQTGVRRADVNEIDESVLAGYVQGSMVIGKLDVVTGVRMERTDDAATGPYTDTRNNAPSVSIESGYSHLFPSVHFRYEIARPLIARASFSTGMSRPNISDLYPATTVNYSAETVTQNKTSLEAQYSKNIDLSLEYYFEPAGLLSLGFFNKRISGFLASSIEEIGNKPDNGFNGSFSGFDLISKSNLGSADIEGFEANYRQTFATLPKPFNGLGAFANFTKLRTSGTYTGGVSELAGFVPEFGNAGLSYRWRGFEARVAATYAGEYLSGYNVDPNAQQRIKALTTIDISFAYTFRRALTAFVDVVNLEDKWPVTFSGRDSRRVRIVDSYGARLNIGISGRF